MTPKQLLGQVIRQQAVNTESLGDLNQALNFLVSEFIRPNAQQHRQSIERLDRLTDIVETNQAQIASNTQSITGLTNSIITYSDRLEETRIIVAQNASCGAQLDVKLEELSTNMTTFVEESRVAQEQLSGNVSALVEENRAFRESQQTHPAALIVNSRRMSDWSNRQLSC